MEEALEYILSMYPDESTKILNLYQKDEDFRILCSDYLANVRALEECNLNMAKGNEIETELAQLIRDLEQEIVHLLQPGRKR